MSDPYPGQVIRPSKATNSYPGEVVKPAATPKHKPYSMLEGIGQGADKVINNGVSLLEQIPGVKRFNEWISPKLGMAPTQADAVAQQQQHYTQSLYAPSPTGQFIGNMLATAPTNYLPGGPFVQGAAQGGLSTDAKDPMGIARDMVIGGVANKVVGGALNATARAIAPKAAALGKNVRLLIGEGVTALTPGQVARDGGATVKHLAAFEDRAAGQPIVGDMIHADRQAAVDQLNRAVANRALGNIGEKLPDAVATGHDAVTHVGDRLSAGYQELLPRMRGNLDLTFQTRIGAIRSQITGNPAFPEDARAMLDRAQLELSRAFTPDGKFAGRALAQTRDKLDKLAASWSKNEDPYVQEVGAAVGDMRGQLMALVRRQNPADAAKLNGLEKGWAILVRMENAAKGAKGGVFSPGQLTTAVRTSDRSIRKRAVGRGQALLQDLSDAASQVMPSQIPDSGTAGRWAGSTVSGLARGAALSLPYVAAKKDLQRGINSNTGPAAQYVGDLLRWTAPIAGKTAAVAVPSMLSSSVQE